MSKAAFFSYINLTLSLFTTLAPPTQPFLTILRVHVRVQSVPMLEVGFSVWDKQTLKQRFSSDTLQTNGDDIFPRMPRQSMATATKYEYFSVDKIF